MEGLISTGPTPSSFPRLAQSLPFELLEILQWEQRDFVNYWLIIQGPYLLLEYHFLQPISCSAARIGWAQNEGEIKQPRQVLLFRRRNKYNFMFIYLGVAFIEKIISHCGQVHFFLQNKSIYIKYFFLKSLIYINIKF